MILKYRIEIRKSQVSIELLYLCIQLGVWVPLVSHSIIVLWWVLQRVEIVILNVPSA